MNAREWWYKTWRLMRIAKRESMKANMDMILYGTGVVEINSEGEAKRIDPAEVFIIKKPDN